MSSPFAVASIAYICYTMPGQLVKPQNRCIAPPGQEAAHALESLVESGVRVAARLRPDPNFPVDGALSCGYGYPARNCWGSPASFVPWDWSPPATTGSWTSS